MSSRPRFWPVGPATLACHRFFMIPQHWKAVGWLIFRLALMWGTWQLIDDFSVDRSQERPAIVIPAAQRL